MRTTTRALLSFSFAIPRATNAATVLWTNTAGGAWTTAANWNPNQVPSFGDYTVTDFGQRFYRGVAQ